MILRIDREASVPGSKPEAVVKARGFDPLILSDYGDRRSMVDRRIVASVTAGSIPPGRMIPGSSIG